MRPALVIVLLTLVVGCQESPPPAESGPQPATTPAPTAPPRQDDLSGDTPKVDAAALPAPPGAIYHVGAAPGKTGDGSRKAPLRDLQAALCGLRPGDRLVVLKGVYHGALLVDRECAAGTPDTPIEVYVEADAVLEVGVESPGLTLASDHWRINGLEIEPGEVASPALLLDGARDVVIENCHLHNGRGDGVVIHSTSREVTVRRCHLHHFGMPPRPQGAAPAAGIRVAPGADGVTLARNGIHNVRGMPVDAPEGVHLEHNQIKEWGDED